MMTLSDRGADPRISRNSLGDFILYLYFSERANVIAIYSSIRRRVIAEIFKPLAGSLCDGSLVPKRGIAPMFDFGQHSCNAIIKFNLRLPIKSFADLADVSESAIRFARTLGTVYDLATEQTHEMIDSLGIAGPNVEPLPGNI